MKNSSPTTLASTMSPARVAAEAAFAKKSLSDAPDIDPGGEPTVFMKRHRAVETNSEPERKHEAGQVGGPRSPKIYRVEPAPSRSDSGSNNSDKRDESFLDVGEPRPSELIAPRRSRQRRHGEVKIIRPGRSAPVDELNFLASSSDRLPRSSVVEKPSEHGYTFDIATIRRCASKDYASVMADIRKLEQMAKALKKAEAAKTVLWIRRAIADYGLDAADVGL